MILLGGMQVVTSPTLMPARRYTFDPDHKVPVSDEMRREMEEWVKEFFACEHTIYRMKNPVTGSDIIVMHPDMLEQIKKAANVGQPYSDQYPFQFGIDIAGT